MSPEERTKIIKALRRKGEIKTQTEILSRIKLERGQQIPPKDAIQIRTAAERLLTEDPKSLIFLVGGAARMYRGMQPAFRDIDIAIVTSKGSVYNKLSKGTKEYRKFMRELGELAGRKVDVIAYKRQHFKKPSNILRQLAIEQKQRLFSINMLVNGIPLYNIKRAQNFQEPLRGYLRMAHDETERKQIDKWHVGRSVSGLIEEGVLGKRDLNDLIKKIQENNTMQKKRRFRK